MGFFDELIGAANEFRDAIAEPIADLKDSFQEGFSGINDVKTDVTQHVEDITQGAKDKLGK